MEIMEFVSGLTVYDALCKARNAALKSNKPVLVDINDIIMLVDKKSDIQKLVNEYRNKLDFKYEIINMRIPKQR